jgi:FkbM family methyltransferase
MSIYYGVENNYIDVTYICHLRLKADGVITIPASDDKRAQIFGDPVYGVVKHIKILDNIYSSNEVVIIKGVDIFDPKENRTNWWNNTGKNLSIGEQVKGIHQHLCLDYGSMNDEIPEQEMALRYIKPTDSVLEIGGNIGRNSCLIGTILDDDRRLVVLESNPNHARELIHNRNRNGFTFHVEPSALSNVKLIQKGWDTYVHTTPDIPAGFIPVPTIKLSDLRAKYQQKFNVLVADCEGALYQILQDEPSLLDGIETVIIENDFKIYEHKQYVDEVFASRGLKLVYNRPLHINMPIFDKVKHCFFQVFQK